MSQLATGDLRFQVGVSPPRTVSPEPEHSVTVDGAIRVERDVAITLGDETDIYVDLFRPAEQTDVPVLIVWAVRQAQRRRGVLPVQGRVRAPGAGVLPEWISEYMTFQRPDPKRWCANGYAVMSVDPRAT